MRVAPLLGTAAAALAVAASAAAASKTTAPGDKILVGVRITDQSINVFNGARMSRGVQITFLVTNAGTHPHNFALLGKKTPTIVPGHNARFTVFLLARGSFPYRSTLDKGPRFRGIFIVY